MIIIRIKKYVSVDNIPIQLPKAESHMYPSQQPWGFCSVLYIESSLKLQKYKSAWSDSISSKTMVFVMYNVRQCSDFPDCIIDIYMEK